MDESTQLDQRTGFPAHITLIHALRESIGPITSSFARLWPEAVLRSVLDDGLSQELARTSRLDARMTERFLALGRYASSDEPDAILFTCSAFGPCIEAVRSALAPLPVRKPNEAMVSQAVRLGGRIALIATYAPTLLTMPSEFPHGASILPVHVEGALSALARGDAAEHDRLIVDSALTADADVYALAQFSTARAAPELRKRTVKPVLTTPDAAVLDLKHALSRPSGVRRDVAQSE